MSESFRIKPPQGKDNAWWWEQTGRDVLAIQRCTNCQTLRHPPRPMCGECRSLEWDFVEASGNGHICSYTVLHHPQFPGYQYPLVIILVDLQEGTRFTSQLVDCAPEDVRFDMPVTMVMHEDPDGFKIPVFRPAGAA